MTTVIETLHTSSVTETLNDAEILSIARLFEVRHYSSGQSVDLAETSDNDGLAILANGNIKVKIACGVGESTVCILRPGDMVDLSSLAASTPINARFYAVGNTNVLSMRKNQFDNLVHTHPMIMCQVIHGMMHSLHGIVRRMSDQIADLRNYIYSTNSRI